MELRNKVTAPHLKLRCRQWLQFGAAKHAIALDTHSTDWIIWSLFLKVQAFQLFRQSFRLYAAKKTFHCIWYNKSFSDRVPLSSESKPLPLLKRNIFHNVGFLSFPLILSMNKTLCFLKLTTFMGILSTCYLPVECNN